MAFRIQTALGPRATAKRRKYKLDLIEAEKDLKLEKERTKQLSVAGAEGVFGFRPQEATGIDLSDPTTQAVIGVVVLVGGVAWYKSRKKGRKAA